MKVMFCLQGQEYRGGWEFCWTVASQAQDVRADHPGLEKGIPTSRAQVFSWKCHTDPWEMVTSEVFFGLAWEEREDWIFPFPSALHSLCELF